MFAPRAGGWSGIAAKDIGACAFGILKAGDTYIGKTVGISGGHLTGEDMAASQVKRDFQDVYLGARDLDLSRTSNPGIKTFGDWLETYGDQLPRDATSTAAVLAG